MVQLNWTYQAVLDLRDIAEYISKDSQKYASLQVQRIKLRTQILKSHPTAGQQIDFYANPSIRQLTEGNYNIIYKIISPIRVDILSVHHAARDLGSRNI